MHSTLELTGERTLPGLPAENYWFRRHEAAYAWVCDRLTQRVAPPDLVVDAGCGEGYGAAMLRASVSGRLLGLDYDAAAAHHARQTYGRSARLAVARANLVHLPLADASVDVLVSAQVIEHLWEQERFVHECARVLAPGGLLVVTTPNRRTFPPGNLYHYRELDAEELVSLLAADFPTVGMWGLHHGPRLLAEDELAGGLVEAQLACEPELWPESVRQRVEAVTADDFVISERVADCLDLVALATPGPS